MLRLFISLDICEKVQQFCLQEMRRLEKALNHLSRGIKWTAPESLHFTLQFLGNTPENMAPQIRETLEPAVDQFNSFLAQWKNLQGFPSLNKPRILYFGISQGKLEMEAIAQWVQSRLETLGFAPDKRPFIPHLTFARVKDFDLASRIGQKVSTFALSEMPPFEISNISLRKSILGFSGSRYETLAEFTLSKQPESNESKTE